MLIKPGRMYNVVDHGSYLEKNIMENDYDIQIIALNIDHLEMVEETINDLRAKINKQIPGKIREFKLIFNCSEYQGFDLDDQSDIFKKTAECKVFIKYNIIE